MTQNLRIGGFIGIFMGAATIATLIDASRFQRSLEVVTIAEARLGERPVPPIASTYAKHPRAIKVTPVRHTNSTLADFIAPYRDCSVPAAANAIADDPRCEGLSLSENEPLETDPH